MSLRVIFMGTPDFAVPTLTEIVGQGHEVVSCYTRAPAQAGRGLDLKPSPVQRAAERFGIPVFTPTTLKTAEAAEIIASHQADVAVVVAYGMILPQAILDLPELGCLNLHASLLPRPVHHDLRPEVTSAAPGPTTEPAPDDRNAP